jgi:hypothetical protein
MYSCDVPQSPPTALEMLADCPYGFSFVDLGFTSGDLADLGQIQIGTNKDLNEYGNLQDLRGKIADFLAALGPNEHSLVQRVAYKIDRITQEIVATSGREAAWVCLRAAIPNHKYDIPRWHMDGHYFTQRTELQYKFILSLIGPSTLFYPISNQFTELRRIIWIHMANRLFTDQLCERSRVMQPQTCIGAYFIAGDPNRSALHSEPPISENRLVFSIVPCRRDQIALLKQKADQFYRNKSSVND